MVWERPEFGSRPRKFSNATVAEKALADRKSLEETGWGGEFWVIQISLGSGDFTYTITLFRKMSTPSLVF